MYEDKMDSRMEIAQKMRDQCLENSCRARYWYRTPEVLENASGETPEIGLRRFLMQVRILAAVFLVGGVIFLDKNNGRIGSLDAGKIFEWIALDYEEVMTEKLVSLIEDSRR